MTPLLRDAASRLRAAGIESHNREARLLLAHVLKIREEDVIAGTVEPDGDSRMRFEAIVARRTAREPLAYITGRKEFWSLPFKVAPGVLIPRPETETLVGEALRVFDKPDQDLRVLDLGTGSGCILLSFLNERPNAKGVGVDASPEALRVARENAETLGLAKRASFVPGGWEEGGKGYDVIFCNPPYIRRDEIAKLEPELSFEPRSALDGGEDGLDCYRALAPALRLSLGSNGYAFVELGHGQDDSVAAIFRGAGLVVAGFAPDLSGIPRCITARLAT